MKIFIASLGLFFTFTSMANCQKSVRESVTKAEFPLGVSSSQKLTVEIDLGVKKGKDLVYRAIIASDSLDTELPVVVYDVRATGSERRCKIETSIESVI